MSRSSDRNPEDLEGLARAMRGSLASLRAASETLERFPGMDAEPRRRLHGVVAEESLRLAGLVDRLERLASGRGRAERRPIGAAELVALLRDALGRPGLEIVADEEDAVPAAPLELDLGQVTAAFRGFAAVLRKDFAVVRCHLRAEEVDRHLLVDCAWHPDPADVPRLHDWRGEALERGRSAPALRTVAREHGGEAWFDLDRTPGPSGRRAHVRVLLPLAELGGEDTPTADDPT